MTGLFGLPALGPGWPPVILSAVLVLILLGLRALALRVWGAERYRRIGLGVERGVLTALILSMVLLSALQIALRNFFESGLLWIDPLLRHLVLWTCFLGGAAATSRGRHIQIDLVGIFLKAGELKDRLHRVASGMAALVCLALAGGAYTYLQQEREAGVSAFLGLESWQVQGVLYFGFVFLAYRFIVVMLEGTDEAKAGAFSEPVVADATTSDL